MLIFQPKLQNISLLVISTDALKVIRKQENILLANGHYDLERYNEKNLPMT